MQRIFQLFCFAAIVFVAMIADATHIGRADVSLQCQMQCQLDYGASCSSRSDDPDNASHCAESLRRCEEKCSR